MSGAFSMMSVLMAGLGAFRLLSTPSQRAHQKPACSNHGKCAYRLQRLRMPKLARYLPPLASAALWLHAALSMTSLPID